MNQDKLKKMSDELMEEFSICVINKLPRCREVLGGALAASAFVMVAAVTRLTKDRDEAVELTSIAISGAFKMVETADNEMRQEKYK